MVRRIRAAFLVIGVVGLFAAGMSWIYDSPVGLTISAVAMIGLSLAVFWLGMRAFEASEPNQTPQH